MSMGTLGRALYAFSPQARRLQRLARIAGISEALAAALKRHAETAGYATFRTALEHVAEAEAADAKALRRLLLAYGSWPIPFSELAPDGSSNWQRVSADLALERELVKLLGDAIVEWEGVKPEIANDLRAIVYHKEVSARHLRDLGLRCDPQALD
jgi:hypothetical protein